ncbi:MAG: hypothetical protein RML72_03515 [Bacteroidia bacterium]|nr:hypothetical protein [Bacteroidia bacterium]
MGIVGNKCYYELIEGFVKGRRYLVSFCRQVNNIHFDNAFNGYDTYLLITDNDNDTIIAQGDDGPNCEGSYNSPGATTIEFTAPKTGALRFYTFRKQGNSCSGEDYDQNNAKFGYIELCKAGTLSPSSRDKIYLSDSLFNLKYKDASGAETYILQVSYDEGSTWEDLPHKVQHQDTSPIYYFRNIKLDKRKVKAGKKVFLRVKHDRGSCGTGQVYSNTITICPPKVILRSDIDKYYCIPNPSSFNFNLVARDSLFPNDVRYNWWQIKPRIQQIELNNTSGQVQVSGPSEIANQKVSCVTHEYKVEVNFETLPQCSSEDSIKIQFCRLIPFIVISDSAVCCTSNAKIQVRIALKEQGWDKRTLEEAIKEHGYKFELLQHQTLFDTTLTKFIRPNCTTICSTNEEDEDIYTNIEVTQVIGGCMDKQNGRTKIACPPETLFRVSQQLVCTNQLTNIKVDKVNSKTKYSWKCDSGAQFCPRDTIGYGGEHTISWSSPGTKTIQLTVKKDEVCGAFYSSQTVTVNQNVRPTINLSDSIICENQNIDVRVQTPGLVGNARYLWKCDGCVSSPTILENQWTTSIINRVS